MQVHIRSPRSPRSRCLVGTRRITNSSRMRRKAAIQGNLDTETNELREKLSMQEHIEQEQEHLITGANT